MSVEASKNALRRAGIDPREIGAVYVGSESHPYAVKPTGTVVAEAIGATPDVHTADLEFACKAGTEGMFLALALVKAGEVKYALAVGADTSQGAPGDALEYSAAAGAAAYLFGREAVVAECLETHSFTTDTPDFWRREYQYYPEHGGRFTGEPAYFKHITGAAKAIMAKVGRGPGGFSVRRLPSAERQVPVPRRGDPGVQENTDRARLAGQHARQHLFRLFAHRPDRDPGHRQARRQDPARLLRLGRRERRLHLPGHGAASTKSGTSPPRPASCSKTTGSIWTMATYAKYRRKIRKAE